jgi:hypothetical protein
MEYLLGYILAQILIEKTKESSPKSIITMNPMTYKQNERPHLCEHTAATLVDKEKKLYTCVTCNRIIIVKN